VGAARVRGLWQGFSHRSVQRKSQPTSTGLD
jgi:hypothetical protein